MLIFATASSAIERRLDELLASDSIGGRTKVQHLGMAVGHDQLTERSSTVKGLFVYGVSGGAPRLNSP